ncbi:hypothetical protein [Sphaerobacter thermophilus]|uniref:Cytochrome b561 domain-containing protein n=1 Tax=Sphaerobacter thermophilus (strain ATCC 49802 / DSM 20745 / KCCM 41009 / NCIMB 13125 / S 6022) TaxID=479434 RepID=D1C6Z7_SPHTD|nr:hypothetical protein [Sphaerobacter thermophilus]ACZ37758.1 hypothetical protein Sthe_0319 [Sphaerobacter thermophilus DSM 20745]PZN61733.1 MAG: hypothetical protein DIU58_13495 [Sphaerobacter thermophilus]
MNQAHGGLGELLVIVYLGIAIASWILARRQGLPPWLTGTAHALLGVQIIMGIILFVRNPNLVPWTHVLFGLLTIPAIMLVVPLRQRIGRNPAIAVSSAAAGLCALVAVIIAMTR